MTLPEDREAVKRDPPSADGAQGSCGTASPTSRVWRLRARARLLAERLASVSRTVAGPGTRRRALLGWLSRLALVIVLAVAGIVLGLRGAGATTHGTSLGVISLRVEPAWHGEVEAFIPIVDWGVRAHAFSAPVRLHVEPRSANRGALLSAASGKQSVLKQAERDARTAARGALARARSVGCRRRARARDGGSAARAGVAPLDPPSAGAGCSRPPCSRPRCRWRCCCGWRAASTRMRSRTRASTQTARSSRSC